MATRLLLISDTHIPGRARRLPDAVLQAADAADLVIHAGDWVSASVLDDLEGHAEVIGVWGNNDGAELRARLPEVARRTVGRPSEWPLLQLGRRGRHCRTLNEDFCGAWLVWQLVIGWGSSARSISRRCLSRF